MRAILIVFVLIGFMCRAQDGSPDLSFGTNGIVETNVYEFGTHYVTRVTESPDSRIILVGEIFNWTTNDKENYVAAYFENGQLDTDFGNNGFILNSSLFNEEYYFVDTFQNGDILVGGSISFEENYFMKFLVGGSISFEENYFMKFLPDGELDADFADNGVLFPFPGEIQRLQPVITSNNKILFPRTKEINGSVEYILEQYNADGTLDTAFGNNGSISYSFAPNGEFWRSNLIGYGDFYLLSIKVTLNNVTSNYLVRFFANGMMDENFGNSGYLPMPIEEEYFCSPFLVKMLSISIVTIMMNNSSKGYIK